MQVRAAMLLLCLAQNAGACSLLACVDRGVEMRSEFVVLVKHEGKPLRGVDVRVTSYSHEVGSVTFLGMTGIDGRVRVTGLSPGDYWFSADLLGVSAVSYCFHVRERSSWNAKRKVSYEWGDFATETTTVAGKLTDSQPGTGEAPIWNLIHRVVVPIGGAKLTLHAALGGERYTTTSSGDGDFRFEAVPTGTYVLHIEGLESGRPYDPTDLLIRVASKAHRNTLNLLRAEGGCYGVRLALTN